MNASADTLSPANSAAKPALLDGVVPLGHWGLIRARGADAASFLHGQLTSDVLHLDGTQARLSGFCTAKGRLLASFIGWKSTTPDSDGDILLACHQSVLPATLKRLRMFVLRAKCQLSDASGELQLLGLAGASATTVWPGLAQAAIWAQHALADGATLVRLPDAAGQVRALWLAPLALPSPATATSTPLTLDHWRWLEVHSGVPTIEAGAVEQFVPQMLNLELLGGVDFKKGCYPGQEIVARSQYRGTIKRRSFLFDLAAPCAAGQEVFSAADPAQPAGMVVQSAPQPGQTGWSALVEVKLAAVDLSDTPPAELGTAAPALHLGAADGPLLQRRPLPYPVPVEPALAA